MIEASGADDRIIEHADGQADTHPGTTSDIESAGLDSGTISLEGPVSQDVDQSLAKGQPSERVAQATGSLLLTESMDRAPDKQTDRLPNYGAIDVRADQEDTTVIEENRVSGAEAPESARDDLAANEVSSTLDIAMVDARSQEADAHDVQPESAETLEIEEQKDTFIGPGEGRGIPDRVFTYGFDDDVESGTGEKLHCVADDRFVQISQNGDPRMAAEADYYFTAILSQRVDENDVSFGVRTEVNGIRHPDFAAGKLLERTISYYDDEILGPDERVDVIEGHWSGSVNYGGGRHLTDNWRIYTDNLASNGPGPYTATQKAAAAAETKTGKMAAKIGFNHIDGNEIDDTDRDVISVKFRRG